ncbi:MAG: hypothetical protein AAFP77_21435 [Bacteroidota bacterium]
MALAAMTLACFLFYMTSRYFPEQDLPFVQEHKSKVRVLASAIAFISLYLFTRSFDTETAVMVWLMALMTLLSAIILSVKMNVKWIWTWGSLSLLFILIDLL